MDRWITTFELLDMSDSAVESSEQQAQTVTEAVPEKRIRKQKDRDLVYSGNQRGVAAKKQYKPSAAAKERQKAAQQALLAAQYVPEPVNLNILPSVALSSYDKASQLTLSKDQLICHGCEGGYRMVRATHGVHRGSYYYEVELLSAASSGIPNTTEKGEELPPAHVRVGWSTRMGELQAPVGFDQHSYGYRDEAGSKVHRSIRTDHYGASFQAGDVIGCHIALYDDINLNRMSFYKNGVDQGVAFSGAEIPTGVYLPAISIYMKACVRVNFGPSFIKRPDIQGVNAVSELQPMNPEDRKMHELMITAIRRSRGDCN